MLFILSIVLWLSVLTQDTLGQEGINIVSWIEKTGNYQEWLNQLNRDNPRHKQFLENPLFSVTVFVPENEAFQKFTGQPSDDLIGTHIVLNAYDAESLLKLGTVSCLDRNRPKLRLTRGYNKTGETYTYVLNAKILESHKVGDSMVHIIDRVLNPPKLSGSVAPTGLEWINYHNYYPTVPVKNGVETFSSLINSTQSASKFDCLACTFFVPDTIENKLTGLIDSNVLLGHVIPGQILFLRSMNDSTPYKTKADSNELSVELSKEVRAMGGFERSFIYSHTRGSTKSIRLGNTRVKITQADIPVSNGVVHLIEKPLVITDISVLDYLNEEGTSSLTKFYNLLQQHPSLKSIYSRGDPNKRLTLFAFTNEAYESVDNDIMMLTQNATAIEDLLRLHFVDGEIITSQNAGEIKERPSSAANKNLYFSVSGDKLYVEGDGVKAAAVVQDIACTNGVIHVINKVLGIPSSPIKDKLREDPQLKTTYTVAKKLGSDWIEQLGDKSKNFTFFAPSEAAWQKLAGEDPSSYKQLVEGLYRENAKTILNRHLVENQAIPLKVLNTMDSIDTVGSKLHIENSAATGQGVALMYMQLKSSIIRSDIKAINGYIHEIDTILMQDTDLKVDPSQVRANASPTMTQVNPFTIMIIIAASLFKFF